MRLLLIDEDPRYRALLRHHLTCEWPDADIVIHNPVVQGSLPPDFLAQGYDAVLIDEAWPGGDGLDWLRGLAGRGGFAPLIFLTAGSDAGLIANARAAGAGAVIQTAKIGHDALIEAVRAAALRQERTQADWRSGPGARAAQTFGGVYVPGYRCARRLASGSVSDLYLAESVRAGTMVALKVTRDARREDGVDQAFNRFLQEYELVRGVRHPNVVRLHDLGVSDGYAYLVMEYFARGDLRGRMRSPLSVRRTLLYILQIATALQAIHGVGILHRDLKPGNVMVRDDGSLALIDFGLAKHPALELEITDKGLIFGTPHYMSPEQGHGRPVDARSDLYSLGIVLFEMLTGQKPFDGDNPMTIIYKHAKAPVPALAPALAHLQPLLARLLAKDPADRFADAGAACHAIADVLEGVLAGDAPDATVAA